MTGWRQRSGDRGVPPPDARRRAGVPEGEPAIGTGAASIPADVCAFQAIVAKTIDWRAYEVKYVWDSAEPALEPSYSTPAR